MSDYLQDMTELYLKSKFKGTFYLLKYGLILLCLFAILIPTSEDSTQKEMGKLIRHHKKIAHDYGDNYITVLSISTVNTDNNLTKEYNPLKSISYLRELEIRDYEFVPYETTNEKGETITKIRKQLRRVSKERGEHFIDFSATFFHLSFDELVEHKQYKQLLKFDWIFPDESLQFGENEGVREYTLHRLGRTDVLYPNDGKQSWFEFLDKEGIDNLYELGEGTAQDYMFDSSVAPYDPEHGNMIDFAKQFIGRPYYWGAALGDTNRFDCSSFTWYIYKQTTGRGLNRVSYMQYKNAPIKIKKEAVGMLQTGDLVFFNTGQGNVFNPITHVGIYIGDGKFINAQANGVIIDDLSQGYWKGVYTGAGRYT